MVKKRSAAELEAHAVKSDLEVQLEAGRAAQAAKLEQSMAHLKSQLEITSKKYLTVNGYMQARSALEQALFGEEGFDAAEARSRDLAVEMSVIVDGLAKDLDNVDGMTIDETFLDGLMDDGFVQKETHDFTYEVTRQLLIVNLLQNVGPVIDDIVQFRDGTNAELAALQDSLDKQPQRGFDNKLRPFPKQMTVAEGIEATGAPAVVPTAD